MPRERIFLMIYGKSPSAKREPEFGAFVDFGRHSR